jgi:hypothetical protein
MGKRGSPRGLLVVGSRYGEGDTVDVEAQLYDAEMKPFKPDAKAKVLLRVLPPPEITDTPKAWNDGLEMKADAGRPGWFNFRFPVKRSGKYGLELKIPGSAEKLAGKFRVETTDPERDITRPDFALLHRMASEVKAPRDKSKSGVEIALADESRRPAFEQTMSQNRTHVKALVKEAPPGSMNVTPENEADRLFFDLESAHWIPDCLDGNSMQSLSIGKTSDIWDKGWNVFANLQNPDDATGPPWALVLVVALLSVEWLTRKLLKLA